MTVQARRLDAVFETDGLVSVRRPPSSCFLSHEAARRTIRDWGCADAAWRTVSGDVFDWSWGRTRAAGDSHMASTPLQSVDVAQRVLSK